MPSNLSAFVIRRLGVQILDGEEAQEPIKHLLRRFLIHVVAARQRFAADILRPLPPKTERIGEPLAHAAAVSPQH